MKTLLINPPDNLENFLGVGKNFVPTLEPLGLLYIAARCRQEGYDVAVIDAFAEKLSLEKLKEIVTRYMPDVVGLTSFISNGAMVYYLGKWIKQEFPFIKVIFGNVHASVYAELYLKNSCCDIVVHGEGENVFLMILEFLEHRRSIFSTIPSISYLKNGDVITTSDPGVVEDLTELPLPARDMVKQKLYNIPPLSNMPYFGKKRNKAKHMFTSRGCPFSCTFCVVHKHKTQRHNAVNRVVDEMEILVKTYGADYIFIMDPIFIFPKKRVIEICREIKLRNLNFKWGCEGHVSFVDKELIQEMESAGCHDIAFGIESGVQPILDRVRKGTRISQIEEAMRMVKKNTRILVSGLFILGLPGETYHDSLETIAFAKRIPLDMAQFSILIPYPGSEIFYELKAKGEIAVGAKADGTLDPAVWERYSPYIFDTSHQPVWVTRGLTAESLKKLQKKALREFYFRPAQLYMQAKRVRLSQLRMTLATFFRTFF